MYLEFTKMHGLGNDFILIDNLSGGIHLTQEQIIFLCDRKKGVGADGVILIEKTQNTDCFMNYYNSDGTLAEMCGNGIRCLAKFLKDKIYKDKNEFLIHTRAGDRKVSCLENDNYLVNMGSPIFIHKDFPQPFLDFDNFKFECVSVGNPHAITLTSNVSSIDLKKIGPSIENNKIFPNKINVEFVEKKSPNGYLVRVWERGCGETLACGTGASAVYALLRKKGNISDKIFIELLGGILVFSENHLGEILMCGEAKTVYNGFIDVPEKDQFK